MKKNDQRVRPSTKKGQAALEFLMTYGWAILIVLIAMGALMVFIKPIPQMDNNTLMVYNGSAYRLNKTISFIDNYYEFIYDTNSFLEIEKSVFVNDYYICFER